MVVVLKIALTMMKMLYMKIILPILIQSRSFWNVGGVCLDDIDLSGFGFQ